MDLNAAIGAHADWKLKLRGAISRQETLDAATISKDNCCELGKWLHGDGKTKFGTLAGHNDCVQKHATFHMEAGKVASTINAKNYDEAKAMIGPDSAYARASSAVSEAIVRLKKEASL